jgi:hypothetical protein
VRREHEEGENKGRRLGNRKQMDKKENTDKGKATET